MNETATSPPWKAQMDHPLLVQTEICSGLARIPQTATYSQKHKYSQPACCTKCPLSFLIPEQKLINTTAGVSSEGGMDSHHIYQATCPTNKTVDLMVLMYVTSDYVVILSPTKT